jgi:hypothetical protein
MTPVLAALVASRTAVEEAAELLIYARPTTLERCAVVLERSCVTLASSRDSWRGARGDPALVAEARRLHAAVRHAGRLLRNARDYYARWNLILGAMMGGYTSRGDPAAVVRPSRVSLTG